MRRYRHPSARGSTSVSRRSSLNGESGRDGPRLVAVVEGRTRFDDLFDLTDLPRDGRTGGGGVNDRNRRDPTGSSPDLLILRRRVDVRRSRRDTTVSYLPKSSFSSNIRCKSSKPVVKEGGIPGQKTLTPHDPVRRATDKVSTTLNSRLNPARHWQVHYVRVLQVDTRTLRPSSQWVRSLLLRGRRRTASRTRHRLTKLTESQVNCLRKILL